MSGLTTLTIKKWDKLELEASESPENDTIFLTSYKFNLNSSYFRCDLTDVYKQMYLNLMEKEEEKCEQEVKYWLKVMIININLYFPNIDKSLN